jgi:hypothetical protein
VGAGEPGGALHALLQEQEGELCGPRPQRPLEAAEDAAEGFMSAGGLISGSQLLNLMLKDMGGSLTS